MPHRPLTRALTIAVALLALAACTAARVGSGPDRTSLLTSRPAPLGRSCTITEVPATLPAANELVDSAALHGSITALWEGERLGAGYAILSMLYDPFGSNIRRTVIEHSIPAPAADSIQQLVFAHRRTVTAAGEEWGVRLRIDVADSLRFRVGRREVCAPQPRDDIFSPFAITADVRNRSLPRGQGTTVWFRILIGPAGSVRDARLVRGVVGTFYENQILNYLRTISFEPALDDGIPVAGWITLPLRIPRR